jgi:hypothetical protein
MSDGSRRAGAIAAPAGYGARLRKARDGAIVLAAVVLLAVAFFKVRNVGFSFFYKHPDMPWVPLGLAVLGAAAFCRLQYRQIGGPLATVTRGCGATILVFLIAEPTELTTANPLSRSAALYLDYAWPAAIVLGSLGVWRWPSFTVPAAVYAISSRLLAEHVSYFGISILDIRYIVETTVFGAAMMCLTVLVDGVASRSDRFRAGRFDAGGVWARHRESFINACAMTAIGFHLGNYFWSGVAKLALEGGYLSWVLANPTYTSLLVALEKGIAPTGDWPWVNDLVFSGFQQVVVASNVAVLVAQLACIVAVFRIRWLLVLTYFYDVFHLAIYLCAGLFFYLWIGNNLAIAAALWGHRSRPVALTMPLAAIAGIALGYFPDLAGAARLAWYTVPNFRASHFEAELLGGVRVRVPTSFFLSHSYAEAHGRFGVAPPQDHFEQTFGGATPSFARFQDRGRCASPSANDASGGALPRAEAEKLEKVRAFMRAHHVKMLERADRLGHYNFYVRAHHQPSNLLMFRDFNATRLQDVVRYHIVTESMCLRLAGGELDKTVMAWSDYPIDIR